MKIEILYRSDCPNAVRAQELIAKVLAERGSMAEVLHRRISEDSPVDPAHAGSPTILINGRDVEPAEATGMACRIYSNGTGCPSAEVLRAAVERAFEEDSWNEPE